jgi:hypothetical protein
MCPRPRSLAHKLVKESDVLTALGVASGAPTDGALRTSASAARAVLSHVLSHVLSPTRLKRRG